MKRRLQVTMTIEADHLHITGDGVLTAISEMVLAATRMGVLQKIQVSTDGEGIVPTSETVVVANDDYLN